MMKDVNLNGTVNIKGTTGKNTADAQSGEYLKYAAVYAETGTLTVGKDAAVTLGAASHLYGRDVVINGGTIKFDGTSVAGKATTANAGALLRAGDSENSGSLTINGGTLSVAASKFGDIVGDTINMTGGELKVDGTLGLSNNYHDGAKTARMTVTGDATITGSGAFNLANKAVLTVDKAILDNFVKANAAGGKFTFSGPSTQITIKSDAAVDLSKYTYGNGAGADFDVTKDSVVGKIKGESLAISKATAGTLSNTTSTGINVDANILSLGSADTASKLSELQGSVFKYLIARDKLSLAGSGDKFTVDKGDMLLTNNQPEVSVIDGATINFEKGRFLIQGAWSTDSDITLTGADGTTGGNIIVGQSNAKTDSYLTLSGTIKNDKAANTWGGITTDGASTFKNTVDLTKAKFASTGTAGNLVSLHARNNGTIKLTGAQASDILASKDNTKGFAIGVESGGTIEVQGELKADFGDFIEFNATGSVAANNFVIGASGSNGGATNLGGTLVADKINIAASGDTLNLSKASIKSADITLGNGTLKSGSVVATSKLNIGELTLGQEGKFELQGNGSVSGTKLTLNGTDAAVNVSGSWTLNSGLTTTTGTVTVDDESMLTVNGALNVADNTVKVNNGSTFKADYSKANATDKKLGKVDVDATSHLELTNYNKASISLDDLKAQKEKFLGTNVSGLFGITGKNGAAVTVTGTKAENGKVSYTDAQGAANLDGIYAGVTVTGVKGDVTSTNDWGAVELDSGTTSLNIGSSNTAGSVHLNGAAGSNVLVADKDGNAANVALNNQNSVLIINKSGEIKDITAGAANNGNVVVMDNAQLTAGDIGAGTAVGSVDVLGNLVAKNVNAQSITVDGTVSNAKSLTAKEFEIFGNVNADAVTLNASGTMTVEAAAVDTGTLAIGESGSMTVTAGAVVTADTLTGAANATINVGKDGVENGTASLFAGTLNLKSGTLFVDPEYGEHYAAVTVTNFSSQGSTQTDDKSAGLVDGKIKIGKNAALGVGFESKADLDAILANYVGVDGSFYKSSSKGLANALVLNKAITLGATDGIYVAADAVGTTTVTDKNVTIKDGAGLIITDNVFTTDSVTGKKTGTAITVDQTGSINVTDAQLKLIGNFTGADKGLQIFSDTNTAISGTMTIKSANGLLNGELDANTGKMDLKFDRDAAVNAGAFADASEPVRNMLLDQLDGKLAYSKAIGYQLIADAATASLSGAVVDAAAHAATYAGAQQAAVVSVTTMADAMFGRVGAVGVEAASISATGSQANGGVWLTPMYKSMDSDGFNAQGASYGSDVDAAGVAFGADTVNGNMRFGAVFNIGSGDAEGKGNGNGLKDEFDYYGLGIYSAMGFGNFALVGDASLTVISHDVEGHGFKGKADTTAVTMGVTGQYTVATPSVDITPHLGARFIRLNTDSYDLISAKGVEATTDFDVQNVFSVPLGVTLSKGFVAGGWTLAPSADLSVTFNTGDTDAKSTTTFTGVKALSLNTEVLDEVQYGVTLGLGAQSGAFGTSFGINYTGSSNTDSFGVNAQARYMF